METTAISVNDLDYSIHSKKILENISITVSQHQFTGLIGPNGSGKTSLLKHIYRALPVPKKTVYINGREIEALSYKDTAREVSVMRQENASEFPYTILEMVLMGRSPYRKMFEPDTAEDKELAYTALDRVGMAQFSHRMFSNLSGGEKQRVLIARSLAQQADILLLDEPTNHLDVFYQWALMQTIKELDKTVLSVFHELNLACAFCDYLYVLNDHKIVAEGRPKDVCTPTLLEKVFRIDADVHYSETGVPQIIYKRAIM